MLAMAHAVRAGASESKLRFIAQVCGFAPCRGCDYIQSGCRCQGDHEQIECWIALCPELAS